jgi:hypothetical protein
VTIGKHLFATLSTHKHLTRSPTPSTLLAFRQAAVGHLD